MRLVLKLPDGKPPFIGIEFENAWKGESEGREVFSHYRDSVFNLVIQPLSKTMSIRLICDEPVMVKFYTNIEFDSEKFKKWYGIARQGKAINFGHTYSKFSEDNICFIVKEGKKVPMVLKIKTILLEGDGI